MDAKKKETSRKLKKVLHESSSSSSSTSSSNSDTGSSSSSSSPDSRHKLKRRNIRKRKNSSSSEGNGKKVVSKKHLGHKKPSDVKKVVHKKSSHPGKIKKKVVPTHITKKVKSLSPVVKSSHKHLKLGSKKDKMLLDPNDSLRERELLQRDREKLRLREKERRSLSPRTPVRRLSPRRDIKKDRTPERRISSPSSASRYRPGSSRNVKEPPLSARRHESTKERDRRDREAARDKERAEALARCQERQRERERKELRLRRDRERSMEEEKPEPRHKDRLLPRPSERVRMLNATRNTPDKMVDLDRSRSHSRGRSIRDRLDKDYDRGYIAEHRERSLEQDYVMTRTPREDDYIRERKVPRDERDYEPERIYEPAHREERRLAPVEYVGPSRGGYEERHRREPDWEEQERGGRIYERVESRPEWDREIPVGHHSKRPDESFKEARGDWNRGQWNEPQDKWPEKREQKEWPKYTEKSWNEPRGDHHPSPHVPVSHGPAHGGPIQHSAPRRWPTQPAPAAEWSGTPKNETEYRRPMHPHTPKMLGEHGAPAAAPHSFKRHSGAHSNPFHYNYKRYHFNKRHQQSLSQPAAPVSPSLLNSPGKAPLKSLKVLIPGVPSTSLADKIEEATVKKEPLVTSSEMDKDASSEGVIDTTTEDAEKSMGAVDEEQEDNLSEFSDVDDEILNREEELAAEAAAALAAAEATSENGGDSKSHANQELKKEMDLDFEEISDGELEEEAKRHCLADALGVDWASLAKETQRPIEKREDSSWNSIKTRWTPHRILWDVGVSVEMAGEEFALKIMTDARDKLKQERLERRLKRQPIKKEVTSNGEDEEIKTEQNGDIKQESPEIKKEEPEEVQSEDDDLLLDDDSNILLHPLANVQVYLRKMKEKRKHLIMNATGKYGRALSSYNDLKIRRQLCNLPAKEIHMDRNWRPSAELNAQVQLIYQRMVAQVG